MSASPSPMPHRLQDVPPAVARICLQVRRFMVEHLGLTPPWPRCVAGVSGGADSTALVLILHWLGVPMVVGHVDHGLRPESAAEALQVAALAARCGLPCTLRRVDVARLAREQGRGLEDAGRQCRYAELEALRQKYDAAWIVTGHQADDLAEDVLLRLIRGTGWPALGGMAARDDARCLLRPLLHVERHQLEDLLRAVSITWCDDASNASRDFRRNRIRHDIMPLIRAENPAFGRATRQLWHMARLDEAAFAAQIAAVLPPDSSEVRCAEASSAAVTPACSSLYPSTFPLTAQHSAVQLTREQLTPLMPAVRLRVYLAAVRRVCRVNGGQARADALLRLERAWQAGRYGSFQLPGGVCACITRQGVAFSIWPPAAD